MERKRIHRIGRGICLALAAGMLMSVCGCGKKEPSPDAPWNNGYYAVMETENGYYANYSYRHRLNFCDRASGTNILLCGKPECQHEGGDTCAATYHDMRVGNSVLYDGSIYILGREYEDQVASISLYRAALDGSVIDRVGTAFSAKNTSDADCEFELDVAYAAFIIHKGYAYIPIYVAFGHTSKGFVNGGIVKMDIQTGQSEQIQTMEYLTSPKAGKLRASGDYVYFDLEGKGTLRYCTTDGTISSPFGEFGEKNKVYAADIAQDRVYVFTRNAEGGMGLGAFDVKTCEFLGTLFPLDLGAECPGEDDGILWLQAGESADEVGCRRPSSNSERLYFGTPYEYLPGMTAYGDRFFFYADEAGFLYSDKGEKLAQFSYDFPRELSGYSEREDDGLAILLAPPYEEEYRYHTKALNMRISQDKLYAVCQASEPQCYGEYLLDFYYLPIKDLEKGNADWQFAYSAHNYDVFRLHSSDSLNEDDYMKESSDRSIWMHALFGEW